MGMWPFRGHTISHLDEYSCPLESPALLGAGCTPERAPCPTRNYRPVSHLHPLFSHCSQSLGHSTPSYRRLCLHRWSYSSAPSAGQGASAATWGPVPQKGPGLSYSASSSRTWAPICLSGHLQPDCLYLVFPEEPAPWVEAVRS